MPKAQQKSEVLVLAGGTSGLVVVPQPTALTRLHYFDGKLLRADDLDREQQYLRSLVHLSNQAGGSGAVHGFDVALSKKGDALVVGPGMAIDPKGRVLLLPVTGTELGVEDLIQKSQAVSQPAAGGSGSGGAASAASFVHCLPTATSSGEVPAQVPRDTSLYLITVGYAEALCGEDDVFGKLCQDACAGSTDRPYAVEGLVFRAIPLLLGTPLATSTAVALGPVHARSLVASAYYADEKAALPHLLSAAGLRSSTWCKGALLFCGDAVPLAVLSRSGAQTLFLDAWIARRERMEESPRRYWAMRMAMRPWNIYLAQILQFQCQLADLLRGQDSPGSAQDPCAGALSKAADLLAGIKEAIGDAGGQAGAEAIKALEDYLSQATTDITSLPGERMLIEGGIVELPPAGYLPVSPTSLMTVNDQVRRLVGEGLDLRFCVVRPDFVGHALEEAQHMDRISLLAGLDDPDQKPEVDVLVPDGEIVSVTNSDDLYLFRLAVKPNPEMFGDGGDGDGGQQGSSGSEFAFQGASRVELLPGRGAAFHAAGLASSTGQDAAGAVQSTTASGWASLRVESNPFTASPGDIIPISADGDLVAVENGKQGSIQIDATARLRVLSVAHPTSIDWNLTGKLDVIVDATSASSNKPTESDTAKAIFNVQSQFKGAADAAQFVVLATSTNLDEPLKVVLKIAWGGTPLTVQIAVDAAEGDQEISNLFKVKLVLDPDVIQPSNSWHSLALQAISAIGVALQDGMYSDAAEAKLFPSPEQTGGELVVRAVRDWVLFHRRRAKRCGVEPAREALPPRRYQLWALDALDAGGVDAPSPAQVQAAFAGGDAEMIQTLREAAKPITIVEYSHGKAVLLTQESAVKSAWQAGVAEDRTITLGLVATNEDTDTEVLEVARVGRVEQVVAPLTPLAAGATSHALADVPADFVTPGTDGFILCYLGTASAVESQAVYVMELPDWNATSFNPVLWANGQEQTTLLATLGGMTSPVPSVGLGKVDYQAGTATVAADNGVAADYASWTSELDHSVTPAFCDAFTADASLDLADAPVHRDRAAAAAALLQPNGPQVPVEPTSPQTTTLPSNAPTPIVAIVAARPVFANVVTADVNNRGAPISTYLSNNQLPRGTQVSSTTAGRIRLKDDAPHADDVTSVASQAGFPGANTTPYDFLALAGPQGEDMTAKAQGLWSALNALGVFGSAPNGAFTVYEPSFSNEQYKEPGARYTLFLLRVYNPIE